jgi:type IV pilus assembly protein PilB
MATNKTTIALSGLARTLVRGGYIDQENAEKLFLESQKKKTPFVNLVVENKIVPGATVATAAAKEFGMPIVAIDLIEIDPDIIKLIGNNLIKKHSALPIFKRGKRLTIAIADPTNIQALDEIKFATGLAVHAVVVEADKLSKKIEKVIEDTDDSLDNMDDDDFDDLDSLEVAEDGPQEQDDSDVDDAPVVRFVNKCLLDAIKKGASDLHFEPYEKIYRVRFRVDGVLSEIAKPPISLSGKISARIKVMSRLDVSERRVPQDGRIKLKISKSKSIDFRVSTCPTLFGEKAVLRILDSDAAALQIDQLGYEKHQKEMFLTNLHKPYGMFLVTGPTGSGKTVSLYTGINILNKADINISTAEDPVEINLPGVNQVQIDEKTGMDFPKALKAFLRQDPDIILVGEIRDITTGSIAVKAAQTGHMVMSTLHTNDAPQTLTRLQDMGVQAFAVATSINLITAQRLLRRLNPNNRVEIKMPDDALKKEDFPEDMIKAGITLYGPGEDSEDNPGYKGRSGIYQVMPISDDMKRLIIEGANAVQLADQAAAEGIWNIRRSGLEKAANGITSLTEVNRMTLE